MDRYDRLVHDLVNVDSVEGQVLGDDLIRDIGDGVIILFVIRIPPVHDE